MILRLSQKLNAKIKAGTLPEQPPDVNPFADWSAHLFLAGRTQYILLSNTRSLYSAVMSGKGITNDGRFVELALGHLREFMERDGLGSAYRDLIAPASGMVRLARALGRGVTGSMNELIGHAKGLLVEDGLPPFDVGSRLNDVLLSAIAMGGTGSYARPRDVFGAMVSGPAG